MAIRKHLAQNQMLDSPNRKNGSEAFGGIHMRLIQALNRSADACATRRAICGIKHALATCVLAALSVCIVPESSGAEELPSKDRAPAETDVECALAISPDYRLTIERWAPAGECARPVRTRVTDRFLGFACVKNAADRSTCHSFAPSLPSRALDAAGLFHCVEMFVTATDAGIVVTRLKQWVASRKECDWGPSFEAPVTELDFGRGAICTGGICMPADRLSISGKLRLRRLVATALRQLGIATMEKWKSPLPTHPVRLSETQGFFAAAPKPVRRR
jgi:hypothetical protein